MAQKREVNDIVKGESRELLFRKYKSDGKTPDNIDDYSGIIVGMFERRSNASENTQPIEQWSMNVLAGYSNKIVIRDQNADDQAERGFFHVILDASKTQTRMDGYVYFEVKLQIDDAAYEGGKRFKTFIIEKASNGKYYRLISSNYQTQTTLE